MGVGDKLRIRIHNGSRHEAQPYMRQAQILMEQTREQLQLSIGLSIYRLKRDLSDGVSVTTLKIGEQELIDVYLVPKEKEEKKEEVIEGVTTIVYYNARGFVDSDTCYKHIWVYQNGEWIFNASDNPYGFKGAKSVAEVNDDFWWITYGDGLALDITGEKIAYSLFDYGEYAGELSLYISINSGKTFKRVKLIQDSYYGYTQGDPFFCADGNLYFYYGNEGRGYTIEKSEDDGKTWIEIFHYMRTNGWAMTDNTMFSIYASKDILHHGFALAEYYPIQEDGQDRSAGFIIDGVVDVWPMIISGAVHNPYYPIFQQNISRPHIGMTCTPVVYMSKDTVCEHNNFTDVEFSYAVPYATHIYDNTYNWDTQQAVPVKIPIGGSCVIPVDVDGWRVKCTFCGAVWNIVYIGGGYTMAFLQGRGFVADTAYQCKHYSNYSSPLAPSRWGYANYSMPFEFQYLDHLSQLRRNGTVVWSSKDHIQQHPTELISSISYPNNFQKFVTIRCDANRGYWVCTSGALFAPNTTDMIGILFSADDGVTWQHLAVDGITISGITISSYANVCCDVYSDKVAIAVTSFSYSTYIGTLRIIIGTIKNNTIENWETILDDQGIGYNFGFSMPGAIRITTKE